MSALGEGGVQTEVGRRQPQTKLNKFEIANGAQVNSGTEGPPNNIILGAEKAPAR